MVLEAPATGIGEMPRTDLCDVSRLFRITSGASPVALSPTVHGGVTARLPRGAFTLADLVRWMVLPRPVTQASWRSAPLPAVPCRPMATPPIRILALSPAPAFRDAYRARHRLRVLPTGRASSMSGSPIPSRIRPTDQPPRSPGTLAHGATRDIPIAFPARFPRPSSFVSSRGRGQPEAKCQPTPPLPPPPDGNSTSAHPGQRLPPKVHRTDNALCFRAASVRAEYLPK